MWVVIPVGYTGVAAHDVDNSGFSGRQVSSSANVDFIEETLVLYNMSQGKKVCKLDIS